MATTVEAIQKLSEVASMNPVTVGHIARRLREASKSDWPLGGRGRDQAAHVEADHLVNLTLAVTADGAIEATRHQRLCRDLVPADGEHFVVLSTNPEGIPMSAFKVRATLGETLAGMVIDLAADLLLPADRANSAPLRLAAVSVEVCAGSIPPHANIHLTVGELGNGPTARRRHTILFMLPQRDLLAPAYNPEATEAEGRRRMPGVEHRVTVYPWVLTALAGLYADTAAHRAAKAAKGQTPPAGGATQSTLAMPLPTNETAAIDPLAGTTAAVIGDQPATTELDGSVRRHPTGERDIAQPISESRAGRSVHSHRSQTHARHRHPPADLVAA